jgi:MoxR-like ATPase
MQRLVAASALLCGRLRAVKTDLWVFRHIWDTLEQEEVIAAVVEDALAGAETADAHPRAHRGGAPDPEALLRDLDDVASRLERRDLTDSDRAALRDHVGLLSARCQWAQGDERRTFLLGKVEQLWARLGKPER